MILTVTPNPSLDLLYTARRLIWDDANRIAEPRVRPGGQGINVLRALRALGADGCGVTLLGGATGRELAGILEAESTPVRIVSAAGPTRVFVAVEETGTGRSLLLNGPGPARTSDDHDRFISAVADEIAGRKPDWVACCGSLPPGFPDDVYARVCDIARHGGCRCVTDCDGPALRLAAEAGCDLLVPNQHEAARLLGDPVTDAPSAALAAREIRHRYHCHVVAITLGHLGAILSTAAGAWCATPPTLAGTAVGAGDAFLAALLLRLETRQSPPDCFAFAVAAAASVLGSTGADLVCPDRIPSVLETTVVSRITDS